MMRYGLCCIFKAQPIKFRRTTAAHLMKFPRRQQLQRLSEICHHNADQLLGALKWCLAHGIGGFRVNSQILPLKTHPEVGYDIAELPGHTDIVAAFEASGRFCRRNNMRTTFHPDQFILLSSSRGEVVSRSRADLMYQAEVARWVAADVINIYGGGAYGDKASALRRLAAQVELLPDTVRSRLTLENDDRVYTPKDLLPICRELGIPLVYDVHHHRCLPDGAGVASTTAAALRTWSREPLFHLSSPRYGWNGNDPRTHHDYIDSADLPRSWLGLNITVEVEAKAKELAIQQLIRAL